MNEYKYIQDQRVYFKLELDDEKLEGWGTVCGQRGFVVIVKTEVPVKNYPFTHIYLINTQIVEPPSEK